MIILIIFDFLKLYFVRSNETIVIFFNFWLVSLRNGGS